MSDIRIISNSALGSTNQGAYRKYTLHRRPVELVWSENFRNRLEALTIERKLKGWSKAKKAALLAGDCTLISELARNRIDNLRSARSSFDRLRTNG